MTIGERRERAGADSGNRFQNCTIQTSNSDSRLARARHHLIILRQNKPQSERHKVDQGWWRVVGGGGGATGLSSRWTSGPRTRSGARGVVACAHNQSRPVDVQSAAAFDGRSDVDTTFARYRHPSNVITSSNCYHLHGTGRHGMHSRPRYHTAGAPSTQPSTWSAHTQPPRRPTEKQRQRFMHINGEIYRAK